jgi:hypothetical protein
MYRLSFDIGAFGLEIIREFQISDPAKNETDEIFAKNEESDAKEEEEEKDGDEPIVEEEEDASEVLETEPTPSQPKEATSAPPENTPSQPQGKR